VLFELRPTSLLAEFAGEMLRLGNDRQGFRILGDDASEFALLRVIGPPYYTLLRALDADRAGPRAFVERAPQVWVQAGYTHPLVEQLKPADGQWLLLRSPNEWRTVSDSPFNDIYGVLEFALPAAPVQWQERQPEARIRVPLQLVPASSTAAAELWVLRDRGFEQIDELVRTADDQLLERLAFAVAEHDGRTTVILRARPSKQGPPVLVLLGQAFQPFLKLPNLFLPMGTALLPPLRRDAVRKLLAEDADQLVWLYPTGDGGFRPESLADGGFRPLSDWVDYVLHHERRALQEWVAATTFEFEPFVCKDAEAPRPKKKEPAEKRPQPEDHGEAPASPLSLPAVKKGKRPATKVEEALPELPVATPSELQRRLQETEQRFLAFEGPLDDPQRQALWPELAGLNSALGHTADAALCWVQALWPDTPRSTAFADGWHHAEKLKGDEAPAALLARTEPTAGEARAVAAWLTARRQSLEPARLAEVRRFLERHEDLLPVRAAWLAAAAAFRLSHGDVLALTRTRDRLLQRLFEKGLTHDQDLPSFLRFSGVASSDRMREFRNWLVDLPGRVERWVAARTFPTTEADAGDTNAYAHLMLAFGLARLGDDNVATRLLGRAEEWLKERGGPEQDVHVVLLQAFRHRIEQALQGKPVAGPLPAEVLEYAAQMPQEVRFKVDRLRMTSRILEPHHEVDAFRTYHKLDDAQAALVRLQDIADREQLEKESRRLLADAFRASSPSHYRRFMTVDALLRAAPRTSEDFAREVLALAPATCDAHDDLMERGRVLGRALVVAAHFSQADIVPALLACFRRVLRPSHGALTLDQLEQLAGKCFRGLRKLGMNDEIRLLLAEVTDVVTRGMPFTGLRLSPQWPGIVTVLLHVAAGSFYFNDEPEGRRLLEEARELLYQGGLERQEQTKLACTYAATLGQAPVALALHAIDEMLTKLRRVYDGYLTNSHYSLAKLRVVEAIVLAVVTEEFAMGEVARRWLEDDEYLVRKRIHRDVQDALGKH
jgi:hypothetical protein